MKNGGSYINSLTKLNKSFRYQNILEFTNEGTQELAKK